MKIHKYIQKAIPPFVAAGYDFYKMLRGAIPDREVVDALEKGRECGLKSGVTEFSDPEVILPLIATTTLAIAGVMSNISVEIHALTSFFGIYLMNQIIADEDAEVGLIPSLTGVVGASLATAAAGVASNLPEAVFTLGYIVNGMEISESALVSEVSNYVNVALCGSAGIVGVSYAAMSNGANSYNEYFQNTLQNIRNRIDEFGVGIGAAIVVTPGVLYGSEIVHNSVYGLSYGGLLLGLSALGGKKLLEINKQRGDKEESKHSENGNDDKNVSSVNLDNKGSLEKLETWKEALKNIIEKEKNSRMKHAYVILFSVVTLSLVSDSLVAAPLLEAFEKLGMSNTALSVSNSILSSFPEFLITLGVSLKVGRDIATGENEGDSGNDTNRILDGFFDVVNWSGISNAIIVGLQYTGAGIGKVLT